MSIPRLASHVAGAWLEGGEPATQVSPWDPADVVAEVVWGGPDVVEQAADAARMAAEGWARTPGPARESVLRGAAELLDRRAEAIGRDLSREQGKTISEAVGETRRAAQILRYFAAQAGTAADGGTYPTGAAETLLYARREPLGVVSVVTPWNFPIAIPAWKLAPALAYGNAVLWKPAELTPLTAFHLQSALAEAGVPPGVLNLVLGPGSTLGDALVGHPHVDGVTFTGSNAVGQRVLGIAAAAGKRVQLELGGKNPSVVLAGAVLHDAAVVVARAAFLSAGQKCTATSRVIVEQPVLDEFVDHLVAVTDSLVVGAPLDPATDVGPLSSHSAAAAVRRYVEIGEREGTRLTRRAPDDVPAGPYVAPVVFAGLPDRSTLLREEIFGPVVAVQPAESFDHAVALANDTSFGLSASVFTNDLSQALRFASEARVGVVKINQESTGNEPHVPFGGVKASSHGASEQGEAAREFFTHWKTVAVAWGRS